MLGEVLAENGTLTSLNVESNLIFTAGIEAIATALGRNGRLRELKLANQHLAFGQAAEEKLAAALEGHTALLHLTIDLRSLRARELINKYLTRNHELQRAARRRAATGVEEEVQPAQFFSHFASDAQRFGPPRVAASGSSDSSGSGGGRGSAAARPRTETIGGGDGQCRSSAADSACNSACDEEAAVELEAQLEAQVVGMRLGGEARDRTQTIGGGDGQGWRGSTVESRDDDDE